jgi:starch phosphorylase
MKFNKTHFKSAVESRIKSEYGKAVSEANPQEIYQAVSQSVMELVTDDWIATRKTQDKKTVKKAFYLSAEFLMGRAYGNNLVNTGLLADVQSVLDELGLDANLIEDQEPDAGLGNGGLGRLAACFLDSLATHDLPGHGYGIRYKYGMFRQALENGYQVEYPDNWLQHGDPWGIKNADDRVMVKFGGHVTVYQDEQGREHFKRINAEEIVATPFDYPVIGYDTKTVNTLRLWEAESADGFDLQLFNDMQYLKAVEKSNSAEDISRVLYPNDNGPEGKALRLKQQYFFVSASLQDIVKKYKITHGDDFSNFHKFIGIQLNDTHPVVAIPELMRILMDWEKLTWDEAWAITTKTCAYTNHTILAEALEKWSIGLFAGLLPRIYMIVEEIQRRFVEEIRSKYGNNHAKIKELSIISDGVIKMAWLAIHGSHSVNGVAALHTEILKSSELKQWYELYPEKFNNKTNGITQRRFLLKSNKGLSDLLNDKIGTLWAKELDEIKKLEAFKDDKSVIKALQTIKKENKVAFAQFVKETQNIEIDPDSIFDVQIKRLHEYKRQLLNILHVMVLYNRLKENPKLDMVPRTFIFGAKAASGYRRAKNIIKLITTVGDHVNNDASIGGKLKVVMLENYRVSVAEKLIPASDVSEQISTAGKEASGTGNMKFMLNGALTIGTLDGANVEIAEEAGEENCFIFGLKVEDVTRLNNDGSYNPWDVAEEYPEIKKVMSQLVDGTYNKESFDLFKELHDSIMYGTEGNVADQYYVLKDLPSYMDAQAKLDKAYRDQDNWHRMALLNIANGGKFSSDRTIKEYAKDIWNIKAVPVK